MAMEDKFVKLTHAVYKLLDFFPEGEPLKNRAKEKALSVMDGLVLVSGINGWASLQKEKTESRLLEDIEILQAYLKLAKMHGWIDNVNFLIICQEYDKIKKEINPSFDLTQRVLGFGLEDKISAVLPEPELAENSENVSERQNPPSSEITARQGKILELLKEKEKAQVSDIQTVLPDITKRTIRRDVDDLLKKGKVVRAGEWNQVFYRVS